MLQYMIITVALLAFAFAGIAIKLIFKKNGKFAGTCASQSPFLNPDGEVCGMCGAKPSEQCKK
jgi:hypothetical protein